MSCPGSLWRKICALFFRLCLTFLHVLSAWNVALQSMEAVEELHSLFILCFKVSTLEHVASDRLPECCTIIWYGALTPFVPASRICLSLNAFCSVRSGVLLVALHWAIQWRSSGLEGGTCLHSGNNCLSYLSFQWTHICTRQSDHAKCWHLLDLYLRACTLCYFSLPSSFHKTMPFWHGGRLAYLWHQLLRCSLLERQMQRQTRQVTLEYCTRVCGHALW